MEIREGQDASFECRAVVSGGTVHSFVRWTKVGGPMPASVHNPQDSRLHFGHANVHDSGRYACVATHGGRSVEAYATLRVKSYGPQEAKVSQASATGTCMADERACASTNECVKSEYW